MTKRVAPQCDHCRKSCTKSIVRNADGVWCSVKHHAAAMKLRAVAVEPELEPVDIAGRIETALARRDPATIMAPPIAALEHDRILADWFGGKSPDTVRSYTGHLQHFARWATEYDPQRFQGTPIAIALTLLRLPADESNLIVRAWIVSQLGGKKTAPKAATGIMARYRALRSLATQLKRVDHVTDVKQVLPKVHKRTVYEARERYRGVPEAFATIFAGLAELARKKDPKPIDVRDWTLLRFDGGLGLRRYEVVNIDLEHLRGGMAWVHGKGRQQREPRPVSPDLQREIKRWLEIRKAAGAPPHGPLFIGMHAKEGKRLTRDAVNKMLVRRSVQFKTARRLTPHDIRRVMVTGAIKRYGIYGALVHSRHASVETAALYDTSQGENAEAEAAQIDGDIAAIANRGRKKKR